MVRCVVMMIIALGVISNGYAAARLITVQPKNDLLNQESSRPASVSCCGVIAQERPGPERITEPTLEMTLPKVVITPPTARLSNSTLVDNANRLEVDLLPQTSIFNKSESEPSIVTRATEPQVEAPSSFKPLLVLDQPSAVVPQAIVEVPAATSSPSPPVQAPFNELPQSSPASPEPTEPRLK